MPLDRASAPLEAGVLFIVSTPIGNLEDITLRALRVLRDAEVVAAEDTRHTQILLRAHGIERRLVSYHQHNEAARSAELIAHLEAGRTVAVVSDAGTPGVSDPAFRVVQAAIESGIRVTAVPGPSAVLTALLLAGVPRAEFVSLGFFPQRGRARRDAIERIAREDRPTVFFDSPQRVAKTLAALADVMPERPAAMLREMTKVHEEARRGPLRALAAGALEDPPRGEVTVVVAAPSSVAPALELSPAARAEKARLVASGLDDAEATRRVVALYGAGRRKGGS